MGAVPVLSQGRIIFDYDTDLLGPRNLNTNPLDITGLNGALFDFQVFNFFKSGLSSSVTRLRANSDATNNYRDYYMQGANANPSAFVSDTNDHTNINSGAQGYPTIGMTYINGSAGDERHFSTLFSTSTGASDTRVRVTDGYWKNTADPITSLQISKGASQNHEFHIVIFAVPKNQNQQTWEQVGEPLEWVAESTTKSFTGIDGDVDGEYEIRWSAAVELGFVFNNDNAANYGRQRLINGAGSISAGNNTLSNVPTHGDQVRARIQAESGRDRLVSCDGSKTTQQQQKSATWWQNTADPITSIDCTPSSSATGKAYLFKRRLPERTADVLPWETVKEINLSNEALDETVNVSGDDLFLVKIEYLAERDSGVGAVALQINGDTLNTDYDSQYLQGDNSAVTALAADNPHMRIAANMNSSNDVNSCELILYPRSGDYRPALSKGWVNEDNIRFSAHWWLNTADPITTLRVYDTAGGLATGKLRISIIPRIQ